MNSKKTANALAVGMAVFAVIGVMVLSYFAVSGLIKVWEWIL